MATLKMAKAEGSVVRELLKIEREDVLILDDFGIRPLDQQSRPSLMDIIEDRHGKLSSITPQLRVSGW
jgi:DNA replication protein DnaC